MNPVVWCSRCIRVTFIGYVIVAALGCEGARLKYNVRRYTGDGVIRYLEPTGPFISPGCRIDLPAFAAQGVVEERYNLRSIPAGGPYVIYLMIPSQTSPDVMSSASFSFVVRKGPDIVQSGSARLGDMINWESPDETTYLRLYLDAKSRFHARDTGAAWWLEIKMDNQVTDEPVVAHVMIQRGGSK